MVLSALAVTVTLLYAALLVTSTSNVGYRAADAEIVPYTAATSAKAQRLKMRRLNEAGLPDMVVMFGSILCNRLREPKPGCTRRAIQSAQNPWFCAELCGFVTFGSGLSTGSLSVVDVRLPRI